LLSKPEGISTFATETQRHKEKTRRNHGDFRERGFARAIRPDETKDFALVNVERNVAHRFDGRFELATKKSFQAKERDRISLREVID